MNSDWAEFLFYVFRSCRKSPGWEEIKKCHDEEDLRYFEMLEQEKIETLAYPNSDKGLSNWANKDVRVCAY